MPTDGNPTQDTPAEDLGIFPEHDEDISEPSVDGGESDTQETSSPSETEEPETETQEQETEPEEQEASQEVQPEEITEKFIFRGKEYASQKAAEDAISSWEGRISQENQRRQEAEERLRDYYRYVEETKKLNDELVSRLDGTQPAEGEAEEARGPGVLDEKDWEEIQRIMDIAEKQGYDPNLTGMRVVAEKLSEQYNNLLEQKLSEVEAPLKMQEDVQRFNTAAQELFVWAADLADEEGQPYYPELAVGSDGKLLNPEFATEMFLSWSNIAQKHGDFGFTPEGINYAYRLARDRTETRSSPRTVSDTEDNVSDNIARDAQGRFKKASDASAEASSSAGTPSVNPATEKKPTDHQTEALSRMRGIQSVRGKETGEDLGFFPE